jgi:hypothetical protein
MADTPTPADVLVAAFAQASDLADEPEMASLALAVLAEAGYVVVQVPDGVDLGRVADHMRDDLPGWFDLLDRWIVYQGRPELAGTEIQDDLRTASTVVEAVARAQEAQR